MYHTGEKLVQVKAGVAHKAARLQEIIRPEMPGQHAHFFANQQALYISSRDSKGLVWGSVLVGKPGFLHATSSKIMKVVRPHLHPADPSNLALGSHLGALGIEPLTRRRNRLNATITEALGPEGQMTLGVDLTFGNCPKYIQGRDLQLQEQLLHSYRTSPQDIVRGGALLGEEQVALVKGADTFFLGTCFEGPLEKGVYPGARGCDMSHRGGPVGFVQVREGGGKLTWADYEGNNMFQSLGNIAVNPRAGLLFVDWASGDTLHLAGTASINFEDRSLPGAQRSVSLLLQEFVHIKANLPFRQVDATNFSPYLPRVPTPLPQAAAPAPGRPAASTPAAAQPTGGEHGAQAAARESAAQQQQQPAVSSSTQQLLECVAVTDEAPGVKTFEFKLPAALTPAAPGASHTAAPPYVPGQHAVFEVSSALLRAGPGQQGRAEDDDAAAVLTRTWTISSHPEWSRSSGAFRITVKRVGKVTEWMHDRLKPGDRYLSLKAIAGSFTSDLIRTTSSPSSREVILLAGGIGITPFLPMLQELLRPTGETTAARSSPAAGVSATAAGGSGAAAGGAAAAAVAATLLARWHVTLVYSVRRLEEAVFLKELLQLAAGTGGGGFRLVVLVTSSTGFSDAAAAVGLMPDTLGASSSSSSSSGNIRVLAGHRIGTGVMKDVLGPQGADTVACMCGPEGFMQACGELLGQLGLPADRLHQESFEY